MSTKMGSRWPQSVQMLRLELPKFQFRAILAVASKRETSHRTGVRESYFKYVDRTPGRLEEPKSLISCDSCGFEQYEKLSNDADARFAAA